MKKAVLLATLALASLQGAAQKQWVSIGINGFGGNKHESESQTNGAYRSKSTTTFVSPAISYNRFIGKDWGLGLELGYRRIESRSDDNSEVSTGDAHLNSYYRKMSMYRVSPSLFQNYTWKKYRGIASFSIPLELQADVIHENYSKSSSTTPAAITENKEERTSPNEWSIGALVSVAVQRKIVGGLYFGPQIGFGYNRTTTKGTETTTYTTKAPNGTVQKTVTSRDVNAAQTAFTFVPSLHLCYYF